MAFDYTLLDGATRQWLRERTRELRGHLTDSARAQLLAGGALDAVRRRLPGRWLAWLAAEFDLDPRSARRIIATYHAFAQVLQGGHITDLEPGILYLLTRPGIPKAQRLRLLAMASEGRPIPRSARAMAREAPARPRPEPPPPDPNLEALAGAASRGRLTVEQAETDDGATVWRLRVAGPAADLAAREAEAPTLRLALQRLLHGEPRKVCPAKRCPARGEPQPLSAFNRDRNAPDGRTFYCKRCERQRVKEYARKRKARRKP